MPSKEEALKIAEYIGCSGAHKTDNNGWMPCSSQSALMRASAEAEPQKKVLQSELAISRKIKKRKRKHIGKNFERLTESPITGITTLPGGGLVSARPGDVGSL